MTGRPHLMALRAAVPTLRHVSHVPATRAAHGRADVAIDVTRGGCRTVCPVVDLMSPISFRRECMYMHERAQLWASKVRTVLVSDTKARAHALALHLPHCSPIAVCLFYCRSNGSSNATASTASSSMRRCPEQEWQSAHATWRNRPWFERFEIRACHCYGPTRHRLTPM